MLGVQWHPEDLTDGHPLMGRLFETFIGEAAAYSATVAMGLEG
jgi:gamma-glutamyl-gamma-aminobutyrate hydrolase PuuD